MQRWLGIFIITLAVLAAGVAAARVYWLPDYLDENLDRNGDRTNTPGAGGGGGAEHPCSTWGMVDAADKGNMTCTGYEVVPGGLTCYKNCSCPSSYQYTASNCSGNKKPGGAACDGKYSACLCDTTQFPYTSCPSGFKPDGATCSDSSVHYAKCTNLCDTVTAQNCGSFECQTTFPECPTKCKVCYTDNCRNRTDVPAPYGCQTYFADCTSKCQVAYSDNCRNRTAVAAPYGCQTFFADCPAKCEIAYSDNCRNRNDNSTDYGCTKYWADCASKCETGKTCTPTDCSSFTLTVAPANALYESCTVGCGNNVTKYKFTQCNTGYHDTTSFICNGNQLCTWKIN